jgi:hypothetical protein
MDYLGQPFAQQDLLKHPDGLLGTEQAVAEGQGTYVSMVHFDDSSDTLDDLVLHISTLWI